MGTLPRKTQDLLAFCQERTSAWGSNAAAIGLTPAQALDFSTLTTSAKSVYDTQQTALLDAKTATVAARTGVGALRGAAGEYLRIIRAFAAASSDPTTVFNLAKIPPTEPPSPMPAPGTPKDFTLSVDTIGRLELKWKCANPPGSQGTIYMIERRLNETGGWSFTAAVGERKFVDATVPFGTNIVDYRITAQRTDAIGIPGVWTVRFGAGAGGGESVAGTTFTVTQQSPAKLAA